MDYLDVFTKEKLIELVRTNKIKTVHVNNKLVTSSNIEEFINEIYLDSTDIMLSRKYLELFIEDNLIDYVYKNFIKNSCKHMVILNKNKIIDFEITYHAKKQFIKRLIIACKDELTNHSINKNIISLYEEHKNELIKSYFNKTYTDNELIDDLIKVILSDSKVLKKKSITRIGNRKALNRRDKQYNNSNRYVSHPFMFIIDDHILKTVELYSSTVDYRDLNKISSNDKNFKQWFYRNK